jgi:hypothetical protein
MDRLVSDFAAEGKCLAPDESEIERSALPTVMDVLGAHTL